MSVFRSPFVKVVWYLVVFLIIQFLVTVSVLFLWLLKSGMSVEAALRSAGNDGLTLEPKALIIVTVASSALTILLFLLFHWCPVSKTYLRSRPWLVLFWVVLLSLGTIIPSVWLDEVLNVEMPDSFTKLFEGIMGSRWGYLSLGILAPIAEEVVFRGAVLRVLLNAFHRNWHWLPIVISALLFGAVHGNLPQFIHASLLGLLLGWLYYRTGSIVPGIVLHWVNNTIAYILFNLMPQSADSTLTELFGGNERAVLLSLVFSACIFLPSLYQLSLRMKGKDVAG